MCWPFQEDRKSTHNSCKHIRYVQLLHQRMHKRSPPPRPLPPPLPEVGSTNWSIVGLEVWGWSYGLMEERVWGHSLSYTNITWGECVGLHGSWKEQLQTGQACYKFRSASVRSGVCMWTQISINTTHLCSFNGTEPHFLASQVLLVIWRQIADQGISTWDS